MVVMVRIGIVCVFLVDDKVDAGVLGYKLLDAFILGYKNQDVFRECHLCTYDLIIKVQLFTFNYFSYKQS